MEPAPRSAAIDCEDAMSFDYTLGAGLTALLIVYLVYALLRPEKF